MILARAPRPGDAIGVIAPANTMADLAPDLFEVGIRRFADLGLSVRVGRHARGRRGHVSGSVEERLDDFVAMLDDPEVSILLPVFGGYNSLDLLPYLPFERIASARKVLVGHSDITALLAGIGARTGLVTFHGPGFASFCEPRLHPHTMASFEAAVLGGEPVVELRDPGAYADDLWYLDPRAERPYRPSRWRIFRHGEAQGPLVGGNTDTLLALAGTPYFPRCEGAILLLEDNVGTAPGRIDRQLAQLGMMGVLDVIAGLVLGRVGGEADDFIPALLDKHARRIRGPVLHDVTCSHVSPMGTLPLGAPVHLEALGDTPRLVYRRAVETASLPPSRETT